MNDFTKEELIELLHCIDVADANDMGNRCDISNKIQCMIDDYCEHEWEKTKESASYLYCFKCKSTIGKR